MKTLKDVYNKTKVKFSFAFETAQSIKGTELEKIEIYNMIVNDKPFEEICKILDEINSIRAIKQFESYERH